MPRSRSNFASICRDICSRISNNIFSNDFDVLIYLPSKKLFVIQYDIGTGKNVEGYKKLDLNQPQIIVEKLEPLIGDVIPNYTKVYIQKQHQAFFFSDWVKVGEINIKNE